MPIKYQNKCFRRIGTGRIALGFLLLLLVLSVVACNFDETVSSTAARIAVPTQENTPIIQITSIAAPTKVNSQPATLTTAPTKTVEVKQSPVAKTAVPTVLPTLPSPTQPPSVPSAPTVTPTLIGSTVTPTSTAAATEEVTPYAEYDIGQSTRGYPLTAHQFGDGSKHIVIVGGIHGGYEWNTILLAYRAIEYFQTYSGTVPESVTLTIIPSANPDGQELVTGKTGLFSLADLAEDTIPGRFNGNNVDLNRNWDCLWSPTALWRDRTISGGESPFSEPESMVLRDFFMQLRPEAVIFLHSAANGVFASGCPDTHQPSMDLARIYGEAARYPVYDRFSAYEVTGDAGDWLSMQDIASISVELINHQDLDLEKNLAGMLAVLKQYE